MLVSPFLKSTSPCWSWLLLLLLELSLMSLVFRPSMPDFSPYKMGGMNPLRSQINKILLYRTLQNTAIRSVWKCNKLQELLHLFGGVKEMQILNLAPSWNFRGCGIILDQWVQTRYVLLFDLIWPVQWFMLGKYKKNLVNLPWEMVLSSPMLRGK